MACKRDVELAIVNQVMTELTEGRYTFSRVGSNTIQVNGKQDTQFTRVTKPGQALAIANELAARTRRSFNNHVTATVEQKSPYDPITVTFKPSQAYIDHLYYNLPKNEQTDKAMPEDNFFQSEERDQVNSSTGPNSHGQIMLFSPEDNDRGAYLNFINFKKSQLQEYQNRLHRVQVQKKKKDLTIDELNKLNKEEKALENQIEGSHELKIKGLKQEIAELQKNPNIDAVGYYVEKDLQRLDKLSNSNDIDDIREAQKIIDFYSLAGTFRKNVENPFFTQDEIFLEDEDGNLTSLFRLDHSTMDMYKEWKERAEDYQNRIDQRKEEVTVNIVNSDPAVLKTYSGKRFTFDELVNKDSGLKDADWISMWVMDITQGIWSNNGILPQAMFSYLTNKLEKKLAWARDIDERINNITPKVQRELIKMGQSFGKGFGIIGLGGASYQMFKEITKDGNETGGLVQRFTKEFFDALGKAKNNFQQKFEAAKLSTNTHSAFNSAFDDLKKWRRNNSIILDIRKMPEIASDPDLQEFGAVADAAYRSEMVKLLGEKGYKEEVVKQKRLLRKYISDKQFFIDNLLTLEGAADYNSLTDKSKNDISYWQINRSPLKGIEDYYSVDGLMIGQSKANNFMDYNTFVPRQFKPTITANNGQLVFTDTTNSTGYYSEPFKKIEENPILSEFHDILKEVTETIRENLPFEIQAKMAVNTLPALRKTGAEIIADKNTNIMSAIFIAFKRLMEKIRLSFGVNKQSEVSTAIIDPTTGRPNYKVNDAFLQGNTRAIADRYMLEATKFLQAYNRNRTGDRKVKDIRKFSVLPLSEMTTENLIMLKDYLHLDIPLADIQAGRIDKIRAITGESVEIGRYIKDYSMHTIVQTQSFDLPRIAKYFADMTMMYAARQEALPVLEIMKKHYEGIKKPNKTNLGSPIYNTTTNSNETAGFRTRATDQMDDWFNRVALGDFNDEHFGQHGNPTRSASALAKIDKQIDEINQQLNAGNLPQAERERLVKKKESLIIKKNIPRYSDTIYSDEDKKRIKEIDILLEKETDQDKRDKLIKMKAQLGRARTATAVIDNILIWIRTMRLGYNLSSATTNFMEGVTSNMVLASLGEYFDSKEMFYGYGVVKASFVKNITFGKWEMGQSRKNRRLMDKFNVVMDSKNELQKSSVKTYADKLAFLDPHALNTRVEFMNQSPIMIAMLRTIKIKDKDGNESKLWDAFDKDGHLEAPFRTEENVKNWEELQGAEYLSFKQKLHKAIVLAHGNYDQLRGMMIKSNTGGKVLMMFKTWLPMQLYWRFAEEQDDLQSGIKGFKGRYRSYGAGTAAIHLGAVGFGLLGPFGALGGLLAGAGLGKYFGVDSGVPLLLQSWEATKTLAKKMVGMPINLIAGRQLIKQGDKAFDSWVGSGDFTSQDAKNMRGNMADIALQLGWLAMILFVKSLFWDDDDEPDAAERQAHNILINKLMQLSSQAALYVSPVETYNNTIGDNAVFKYGTDLWNEAVKINEFLNGRDVIPSGFNAGESGLWNQTRKTFIPGLFKDRIGGFETQAEQVFDESYFHNWFRSSETLDKQSNQRNRAERKNELENELTLDMFDGDKAEQEKAKEKEIRMMLDREYPTPARLKKLGVTRDEYNEQQEAEE